MVAGQKNEKPPVSSTEAHATVYVGESARKKYNSAIPETDFETIIFEGITDVGKKLYFIKI